MITRRQSAVNSETESDNEFKARAIRKIKSEYDNPDSSEIEIPLSVKAVIKKIEQSQILRAREDILSRLIEIMSKVELIMSRYSVDRSISMKKGSLTGKEKKKRKVFLEKIASYVKTIDLRERTLSRLLSWLEEWNFVLSEVAEIDIEEYYHWVAQMEMMPDVLKAIDRNVITLCQITKMLFEERKQKRKLFARGKLWKAWKERVVKRPATAHALRPEQMICDKFALTTKVSEIQVMLQELISTAMFSKLENSAIKYISATVLNLSKALNTVREELKHMNVQFSGLVVSEDLEKEFPQRAFQELGEENEMLYQKLKDAEEKCDQLIRVKNFLGRQLLSPALPSKTVVATDHGEIDTLLSKEFAKFIGPQKKGVRDTTVRWDSAMTYVAQEEIAPDTAQLEAEDKAHLDQKSLQPEPLDTNLDKQEKKIEIESSQFSDLQAQDMRQKEGKLKGQEARTGTSGVLERVKKGKSDYSLGRSPVPSQLKMEPTFRPIEKEAKAEVEASKIIQPESTLEPHKTEAKGKKIIPGKAEEMPSTSKHRGKLPLKTPKQTSVTPDDKTEQSDLESFQRAILTFLRERMNNVGKIIDPKSIQEEELGRAEVEKLNIIKSIMEEYFQKVAETVTKTLRAYTDAKKGQFTEIIGKQKLTSAISQLFLKQASISTKSDLSNFLLSEMTDPAIRNLVQTLIEELESDRDRMKDERQEAQKQEEEDWRKEQRLQKLEEWKQAQKLLTEDTDKERLKATKDAEDGQKLKGSKPKPSGKLGELKTSFTQPAVMLTPRVTKALKPETSQVQLFQVDPDAMESVEEKQAPSSKTLLGSAKPLPMAIPEQAQIRSPEESQMSMVSLTLEQTQALHGPLIHEQETEEKIPPSTSGQEQELETQHTVSRIPEQTLTLRGSLTSEKPEAMQISQTTAEQVQISGDTVIQRTVLPLQQIQVKDINLTFEQALDQGITPSPEPVKEPRIMLNPQQAQALGITLTTEQAKAQKISLTPQQAQALGLTLTPEQTKEQRISLTPKQAQALGLTLTPQQAEDLGLTLTPEQIKAQRVSLTPQQTQLPGVSLTPQQAQALGITLTLEQARAQRINL
ncbi:hypothetical protein H671_2g6793, partial [Cricetulus griseus]